MLDPPRAVRADASLEPDRSHCCTIYSVLSLSYHLRVYLCDSQEMVLVSGEFRDLDVILLRGVIPARNMWA